MLQILTLFLAFADLFRSFPVALYQLCSVELLFNLRYCTNDLRRKMEVSTGELEPASLHVLALPAILTFKTHNKI